MTNPTLVERDGPTVRITFNRPDRLNALTTDMLTTAADAVENAGSDDSIRVLVVTGAGRAFSSGADLAGSEIEGVPDTSTIDAANRLTKALRQAPKPVVAAVNGPAVGVGCSIALAADLAIARDSAYFLLAFANVGLMPDGGATALIPAAIGRARATRMVMLAERIPAPLAVEWGLIAQASPDDDFTAEADKLVARLAAGPTAAFAQAKHALNTTALANLDTALAAERAGQSTLFTTADFAEGVAAFRTSRKPVFTGR